MVAVGYTLLCEQAGPVDLVDHGIRAEAAGFEHLLVSDHYNPWVEQQGHSPNAWPVIGAVAHATSRIKLMTYITSPIRRYHPAMVAQQASTVGVLSGGRFTLGLGAGENLNEHVVGAWPHVTQRHEMFEEAVQIIRPLLDGEKLIYSGNHYEVPEAYVWDRPDVPVKFAMAASGPRSCELAGEYADGLIAVQPERRLVEMFERAGGRGKPRYGQVAICYGPDEAECRRTVYDQWAWFGLGWKVMSELPEPASFAAATQFVREEDVAASVPCGPDLEGHVAAVKRFVDAGFTHVGLIQVGGASQPMFLDWARDTLLPRLREL